MKKIVLLTLLSFGLSMTTLGQSVKSGKQGGMTDTQVLQYVMQQKKLGKAETEIAQDLLAKGATLEQIQSMRRNTPSSWTLPAWERWPTRPLVMLPTVRGRTTAPSVR